MLMISNPDICDADAVLYQLIHRADWELVIMRVYYKPTDDGGNTWAW